MSTLDATAPRTRPDGLEFNVKGQGYSCRIMDNMNGLIWKTREWAGQHVRVEVLTLHPDAEGMPRLIEKTMPGRKREAFRFTSVPDVTRSVILDSRKGTEHARA